ncbi:hypothetical protein CDAR_253151 [Caerostris darwini]|uniref:Uncharacterized protein n=1 Tax=Caerostris darwini TaxID=1538125 RepID=A0AAV4RBS8_9ARAC|nr:hypothetical protein CDAR_253151 [Caerostris darwini]
MKLLPSLAPSISLTVRQLNPNNTQPAERERYSLQHIRTGNREPSNQIYTNFELKLHCNQYQISSNTLAWGLTNHPYTGLRSLRINADLIIIGVHVSQYSMERTGGIYKCTCTKQTIPSSSLEGQRVVGLWRAFPRLDF